MYDVEQKEAFVFYETFMDSIRELEPEDQTRFMFALVNYGLYGVEETFIGIERALWTQMKHAIDAAKARRRINQENGQKGGRPRTRTETENNPKKTNETEENLKVTTGFLHKTEPKPKITESKPNHNPTETEKNPTETEKNPYGNGKGNVDVEENVDVTGKGKGNGEEKEKGKAAAAAVKHYECLKDYESGEDPPAAQQQQQVFFDFSPNDIYAIIRDIDSRLYFDRNYFAQVALFFNTEARTDWDTAERYIRELVGAAKKYDNPAGYLYRVLTKPDAWQRFVAKNTAADTRTAGGWTCPACGKTYPAGTGCADCGLTARSDAMDIETARKRRELSAQDFEAWQQRREERAEKAKKMREEILVGVF